MGPSVPVGLKLCSQRSSQESRVILAGLPRGDQAWALLLTLCLSLHSPDPVETGEEAKVRVDLLPLHVGRHKLVVNFESDKLKAVKGYRNVIIGPP